MNVNILKLSQDIADDMAQKFSSKEYQDFISETKAVGDNSSGTFEMIISTDHEDRHGEIVDQLGLDISNYMTNAVVLWGHNHNAMPVGITDEIRRETSADGFTRTIAKGRFASHEFAQILRKSYDEKMLNTSSIGFIAKKYEKNRITKSELLEWSFVSIPANPRAVAIVKDAGYDIEDLYSKGFMVKEVDQEEVSPVIEEVELSTVVENQEEAPVEEKGAIADEIVEQDTYELKRALFASISDLYWVFCDVFFDEETPVSDFEMLKQEYISILSGQSEANTLVTDKTIDEIKKNSYTVEEKAGKVLSQKTRDTINAAVMALEGLLAVDSEEETVKETTPECLDVDVQKAKDALQLKKDLQDISGKINLTLKTLKRDTPSFIATIKASNKNY